jgi:hypothetical protein
MGGCNRRRTKPSASDPDDKFRDAGRDDADGAGRGRGVFSPAQALTQQELIAKLESAGYSQVREIKSTAEGTAVKAMKTARKCPSSSTAAAKSKSGTGDWFSRRGNPLPAKNVCRTGLTDNGRVEVTGGLSEETPVVASAKGVPALRTALQPQTVRENS